MSRIKFDFACDVDKAKFLTVIATELFNEMIALDAFWNGIPDNKAFYPVTINETPIANNGVVVKQEMIRGLFSNDVKIGFYRSSWFFRNVVGHFKSSQPNTIYLNTRHYDFKKLKGESLEEDLRDKIETVAHELVHLVDSKSEYSFGHGDNSPVGKENSFPYWFGKYAANFFKHDEFYTKLNVLRGSYGYSVEFGGVTFSNIRIIKDFRG